MKRVKSPELRELLAHHLLDPEAWLNAPNPQFDGRRPGDLVGTDEEVKVLNLLRAYDLGLF